MSGTQSPSSNKPDPMLPKDVSQMTQADQRPGKFSTFWQSSIIIIMGQQSLTRFTAASGNKPGAAPGEKSEGGVSGSAFKVSVVSL